MTFQSQRHTCDFFPVSSYNEATGLHSFSWSDYSNDGSKRIITGRLGFAGRYMSNGKAAMKINDNPWVDLDMSNIFVEKIIGYR